MFNKLITKIKKIETKTIILLFITLSVIFIFIFSNSLEYNLFSKNNNNIDNFYNINQNYNVKFAKNNDITYSDNNNIIYYQDLDEYLVLETITLLNFTNKIKEIFIINNNDLSRINIIFNPENITINDNNNTIITLNKELNLDHLTNYKLIIIYDNNQDDSNNEINISFYVGEKRFRFDKKLLTDEKGESLDKITLQELNENTNSTTDISTNKFILKQFNKLTFLIIKPDITELKNKITLEISKNNLSNLINIKKTLDNFIPSQFLISINKISNIYDINIKPNYKLPNSGSLCLSNKNNILINSICKLTLTNLLPNETYQLKIQIVYTDLNNINNFRVSEMFKKNIIIDNDDTNDIIYKTLKGIGKFDFTNEIISIFDFNNKFNKEQNEQDIKIKNIENLINNTYSKLDKL
jgi:hypothetical protein